MSGEPIQALSGLSVSVFLPLLFPTYAFGSYALAKGERIDERFATVCGYARSGILSLFIATLANILPQTVQRILPYFTVDLMRAG